MRVLLSTVAVLFVVSIALVELTLAPPAGDRVVLYSLFGASAAVTGLVGWGMLRFGRRSRTIRTAVLVPPLAAVAVAAMAVAGAAVTMFLSPHDLRLVLVALTLGIGLGIVLAAALVHPLSTDLHRLAGVARRVSEGDLAVTTDVRRSDEIGEVSDAMDTMVRHLAEAEEARRTNEQARRRFLAAIGHDLRTPMASLQATVEALQDNVSPDPDRYLRSMSSDLEFLRGLVDDLFMLARIESGDLDINPVPVDLAELCDEVVESIRPLAERRHVDLTLAAAVPMPVVADPRAVARVVRNLVDNAIRHTPDGSTVTLTAVTDREGAVVTVSDQGPGFNEGEGVPPGRPATTSGSVPASTDGSWVEPARTRHEARSGLGLTIARGLVEAQGGSMWIGEAAGGEVAFRVPTVQTRPVVW